MLKGIKEIITLGSNEMLVKNHIWSLEVDKLNDILYAGLHDGSIKSFNLSDNKLKCHKGIVYTMVLTKDGNRLFSAGLDQQIKLWCLKTQSELMRLEGHSNVVYTLRLNEERNILFSGSEDGSIRKWCLKTKTNLDTVSGLNSALSSLIVRHDDTLISVDSEKREIIRVYNSKQNEFMGRFDGHLDEVFALEMTADGNTLFSAGNDRNIKIWDFNSRKLLNSVLAHSKCINCLLLTKNNKFLFSCSDDCLVKIWKVTENDLVIFAGINHGCQVLTIKLSRDNRLLFSGGKSSKPVKTWEVDCLQNENEPKELSENQRRVMAHKKKESFGVMFHKKEAQENMISKSRAFHKFDREDEKTINQRVRVDKSKQLNEDNRIEDKAEEGSKKLKLDKSESHKEQVDTSENVMIETNPEAWKKSNQKSNNNLIDVVPVEVDEPASVKEVVSHQSSSNNCKIVQSQLSESEIIESLESLIVQMKSQGSKKSRTKGSVDIFVRVSEQHRNLISIHIPSFSKMLIKFSQERPLSSSHKCYEDVIKMICHFLKFNVEESSFSKANQPLNLKVVKIKKDLLIEIASEIVDNFDMDLYDLEKFIRNISKKEIDLFEIEKIEINRKTARDPCRAVMTVPSLPEKDRKQVNDTIMSMDESSDKSHEKPLNEQQSLQQDLSNEQQASDLEKKDLEFLKGLVDQTEKIKAGIDLNKGQQINDKKSISILTDNQDIVYQNKQLKNEGSKELVKFRNFDLGNCFMYSDSIDDTRKNKFEEFSVIEEMIQVLGDKILNLNNKLRKEEIEKDYFAKSLKFLRGRKTKLEIRQDRLKKNYISIKVQKLEQEQKNTVLIAKSVRMQQQQNSAKVKAKQLTTDLDQVTNQYDKLRYRLQSNEKIHLQKKNELSKELDTKTAELNSIKQKIDKVSYERDKIKSDLNEIKQNDKGIESKTKMETTCFEDFIGFLKKENSTLKEDYSQIKRKYDLLKEENRTHMYDSKVIIFEKTKLEQEKNILLEKIDIMKLKLESLTNSTKEPKANEEVKELTGKPILIDSEDNLDNSQLEKRDHDNTDLGPKKPEPREDSNRSSVSVNNTRFMNSMSSQKAEKNFNSPTVKSLLKAKMDESKPNLPEQVQDESALETEGTKKIQTIEVNTIST